MSTKLSCFAAVISMLSGCGAAEVDAGARRWEKVELSELGVPSTPTLTCNAETLGDGSTVRIELTNASGEPVELLRWGSPWDTKSSPFRISNQNGFANYLGLTALRTHEPPPEAFMAIAPGEKESIEYRADLAYELEPGEEYSVALSRPVLGGRRNGLDAQFEVNCGVGTLTIARLADDAAVVRESLYANPGCNATQTAEINALAKVADRAAYAASRRNFDTSPLYRTWFGDWGAGNARTVGSYVNRYLTRNWDLRCGGDDCCDDPDVIGCKTWQNRLYVCNSWWGNVTSSVVAQSRIATMVHEHTHLDVDGLDGTDDINDISQCGMNADLEGKPCYGSVNARSLAKDPTCDGGDHDCKAIRNAENYAFFVNHSLVVAAYTSVY
jgi:hypothetical protein